MTKPPFVLVTNDDGVYAPGIKHLLKAISKTAEVVVVAPASEQSGVGLSVTIRHPLRIEQINWPYIDAQVWSVNGTPADCIKLALKVILPRTPDLIVSGINRGSNAGRNVLYSGTVAAVIEGILHNIPGIAFSMTEFINPSYSVVDDYIPMIAQYVLHHPLPDGTFLNVNFPKQSHHEIKGVRFATQGKEHWVENPEKRQDPVEGNYFWLGAKLAEFEEEMNSDIALLKEGYITAVPIHVGDLTHYQHIEKHRQQFESFVNHRS